MINKRKQLQKAGEGSTQYQADTIIIQGIDEKRAREICNEMFAIVRNDLANEAYETACQRVNEFENDLIPKMQAIEGALESFRDPSFQFLLTKAHRTAASTERPADYALLSELLIHRIQRGQNRATLAGINRAVEIVDQISDDALLGLSVTFAVEQIFPVSGQISKGLDVLDTLLGEVCYGELPSGNGWVEHLDILDAVRVSPWGNMKKLEDYYAEQMPGYCAAGIPKNSDNLKRAWELLTAVGLTTDLLAPNELVPDYLRLPIVRENHIDSLPLVLQKVIADNVVTEVPIPLSSEQKEAIHQIYLLYDTDNEIMANVKKNFLEELLKRSNLKLVCEWWNSISIGFTVTPIGRVLAHANVKRCDNAIPDLDQ